MTPHYADDLVTLYHGDCLDVLRELPDASVHAVVTDPPYLLGFMGKGWDTRAAHEHLDWHRAWCDQAYRVLKPGGHLLAFGGTRTWHRLACAVEDAGFEIRDSIAWLHAQGFPKSLDVSKAIDKAAGATRETLGMSDALLGRKSGIGNGTDGHHTVGGTRAEAYAITAPATPAAEQWQGWGTALKPAFEPVVVARKPLAGTVAANVLEHGTGALNIDACRVATDAPLGRFNNARTEGSSYVVQREAGLVDNSGGLGRWPANVVLDESQAAALDRQSGAYDGEGGASRYFPTFPRWKYEPKAPTVERPRDGETAHPTVKPLDLMRWLVRLVTPPVTVSCENGCHGTKAQGGAATVQGLRDDVQATGQQPEAAELLEGVRERGDAEAREASGLPDLLDRVHSNEDGRASRDVLLSGLRGEGVGAGEAEGACTGGEGLLGRAAAGSPHGEPLRVRAGAPAGHGRAPGTSAPADRSGASPQRRQDGQPRREPRGAGEAGARPTTEAAAAADRVPALRGPDRRVGTCADCGGALVERGGLVLDPFAGSGTTAEACVIEGSRCVTVEREAAYLPLIVARLSKPIQPDLFGAAG